MNQLELIESFFPTASALRPGDVVEGTGGRAYPRPWKVISIQVTPCGKFVEMEYSETRGAGRGIKVLPRDFPVDLQPPF